MTMFSAFLDLGDNCVRKYFMGEVRKLTVVAHYLFS